MKQKTLFADILGTVTKYFLILVLVVIAGIFLSSIRRVESGNVALVLRFGKLVGNTREEQIHEPGILFAFPYIIDEVVTVPTGSVIEQSVTTHFTEENCDTVSGGYLLTGDRNVAVVSASVKYVITDPVSYALNVRNISAIINACVSTSMIREAASLDVDTLLTDGKDEYAQAVRESAQQKIDLNGIGVSISALELTKVAMPNEVRDTYNMVNSATVQAATILETARQYQQTILPSAQSDVATLLYQANYNYTTAVSGANSDLAEFWGVLDEFTLHPEVVRARIYSAKLSKALERIGTVRLVQDGETKIFINP